MNYKQIEDYILNIPKFRKEGSIEETRKFYYPNDNMFSMSNAEKHISGEILTLKYKYGGKIKKVDNPFTLL